MKRIFQGVHGAGWIALGVGAVAVGGLLIYGAMPAEGQAPVAQEQVAQGTLPLPAPGAAPATAPAPATPTEEERRARAEALAAKANIDITDAWTRATAGAATTAPIYLHIISAKDADRLVSAEVSAAEDIELRENAQPNASKAPMPLEIPAGSTVELSPSAKHFMLTGLKAPLKEGDSFLITLKFDKAGTESAVVKILAPTATSLPVATGRPGDTTQAVSNP
jgi:copper(I)-binding protein